MKAVKKYFLYVLIPLVLIQFVPVDRENPTFDKTMEVSAPSEVMTILNNSCYDCHSNETKWPFYSKIAPISWLVSSDVKDGRRNLNFSEWNKMSDSKKKDKKDEIVEEISRDTMPLPIYLVIHSSASLSNEDKLLLKNWLTDRELN